MSKDWLELIPFYTDLLKHKGWNKVKAIIQFVSDLIENRNLDGLYCHTSHEKLCITLYEKYEDWKDQPLLTIDSTTDSTITIAISDVVKETNEIFREYTEKVYVPIGDSLFYFDEMIEKLKKKCAEQ